MDKLFELERALGEKSTEARKTITKAIEEKRDLNPEEKTKVDSLEKEVRDLTNRIKTFKLRDQFEADDPEDRSEMDKGPELPDLDGNHPYLVNRALAMSLNRHSRNFSGLEGEVHQELARHHGSAPQGILIPMSLKNARMARMALEKRDLTTSTGAGGIANILGSEMIEVLRNRMVMQLLGARVLNGVVGGTFSLPKQNGTTTAYHTAEELAAAISNITLNQVTWTPRTLTGITRMSRKSILQTSLDFEAMSREDLMKVLAIEFDRVGVNGSGQNNQPLGIGQDPNVPLAPATGLGTNGGSISWSSIVALETAVAVANADFGKLAYLTSNQGRGIMKQTAKIGSTFPVFLWEDGIAYGEGKVNGYRAVSTQQVAANLTKGSGTALTQLFFGNFDSATYALWSGMDTLVDPYTQGAAGSVNIYMYQDYDFQLRYEQSFAKIVDMATS